MLTVDRREFTDALRRATRLTPKSVAVQALRTVKLTLDAESVTLQSTNLEQSLVEILPAMGNGKAKPASLCVTAVQLFGVVQALPQYLKEVPIEAHSDRLLVGTTKLTPACPVEDYPALPRSPDHAQAVIEVPEDFPLHLRFVRAAVSQEAARHALTGVLFDFAHGNIVASDGKRLHCAHLWNPSKVASVIVPPAAFDIDLPTHMTVPKAKKDVSFRQACVA